MKKPESTPTERAKDQLIDAALKMRTRPAPDLRESVIAALEGERAIEGQKRIETIADEGVRAPTEGHAEPFAGHSLSLKRWTTRYAYVAASIALMAMLYLIFVNPDMPGDVNEPLAADAARTDGIQRPASGATRTSFSGSPFLVRDSRFVEGKAHLRLTFRNLAEIEAWNQLNPSGAPVFVEIAGAGITGKALRTLVDGNPKIRSLILYDTNVRDSDVLFLSQQAPNSLEWLEFKRCRHLTDKSCRSISNMKQLKFLTIRAFVGQTMSINGQDPWAAFGGVEPYSQFSENAAGHFRNAHHLETLKLEGLDIHMKWVGHLAQLRNVHTLSLRNSTFHMRNDEHLHEELPSLIHREMATPDQNATGKPSSSEFFKQVEHLDIEGVWLEASWLKHAKGGGSLKAIRQAPRDERVIKQSDPDIRGLERLPNLLSLHIGGNGFTAMELGDLELEHLAKAPSLKNLSMRWVSGLSAERIKASLKAMKNLNCLNVSRVSALGDTALSDLPATVTILKFWNQRGISDKAIRSIGELPSLKEASFRVCIGITKNALERLATKHPNALIVGSDGKRVSRQKLVLQFSPARGENFNGLNEKDFAVFAWAIQRLTEPDEFERLDRRGPIAEARNSLKATAQFVSISGSRDVFYASSDHLDTGDYRLWLFMPGQRGSAKTLHTHDFTIQSAEIVTHHLSVERRFITPENKLRTERVLCLNVVPRTTDGRSIHAYGVNQKPALVVQADTSLNRVLSRFQIGHIGNKGTYISQNPIPYGPAGKGTSKLLVFAEGYYPVWRRIDVLDQTALAELPLQNITLSKTLSDAKK